MTANLLRVTLMWLLILLTSKQRVTPASQTRSTEPNTQDAQACHRHQ
uniref:Uncharacterized protein n=1 Tax=Anguilla anguilla TaxID=7936 RepID=A0A0E9Q2D9_ANGAN